MKRIFFALLGVLAFNSCGKAGAQESKNMTVDGKPVNQVSIYDFTMPTIDGKEQSLKAYEGKVVLIVNVASKCGLTPQYTELEAFYKANKDKGFEILGFPANNFLSQEPGTNEEIQSFCSKNYGVSFPMFSKISVKGSDKHALYQYLTTTTGEEVAWNFHKFLVGKDGKVVRSFSPRTSINSEELTQAIKALL